MHIRVERTKLGSNYTDISAGPAVNNLRFLRTLTKSRIFEVDGCLGQEQLAVKIVKLINCY